MDLNGDNLSITSSDSHDLVKSVTSNNSIIVPHRLTDLNRVEWVVLLEHVFIEIVHLALTHVSNDALALIQ